MDSTTSIARRVQDWLKRRGEEPHSGQQECELSAAGANEAATLIWQAIQRESGRERREELEGRFVRAAGLQMQYFERAFGEARDGERSLWISMHGGGACPRADNDSQWRNQILLYEPDEGVMVAPRAPTDTWDLWHLPHVDDLFDRLISNFVLLRGVSPDRVYLLGYSAGGDGVYQLAPRMADRFAAAAMMAGHPNDACPLSLRCLPFMIFVGGKDDAYNRNTVAADWGTKLDELAALDGDGYEHKTTVYEDVGHWMGGRDCEALPWMSARRRNPWPLKLTWRQAARTHRQFYWLAVPAEQAQPGYIIHAEVNGQSVSLTTQGDGVATVFVRLSDALLNLDEPVKVSVNGDTRFEGYVQRSLGAIFQSLRDRPDQCSTATAIVQVSV